MVTEQKCATRFKKLGSTSQEMHLKVNVFLIQMHFWEEIYSGT
jgi:hypothetical protein